MNTVKSKPADSLPKILVLYGSPHQSGATARLLGSFLQPLEGLCEVELLRAFDQPAAPCTGCLSCEHTPGCSQPDFVGLEQKVRMARVLVIATPVYFLSYPAPLKALIDRFQCYWAMRVSHGIRPVYAPRKTGVLLACAGSDDVRCQDMLLAQTRMAYSVVDTDISHAVFWMGIDRENTGEQQALERARLAGEAVARQLDKEKGGTPFAE